MQYRFLYLLIILVCNTSFSPVHSKESVVKPAMGTIPFITTWKTDNPGLSDNNTIIIPTYGLETYNYTVDWGDGNTTTGATGNATHSYASPGTYTVTITGLFPRIFFGGSSDEQKIVTIEQWGDNAWTSMNAAFEDCVNLQGNFTDSPDLSNVTDMSRMFTDAAAFDHPIGTWDVSNVTNMNSLFFGATSFNQDIGNWNVGNVTDMSDMFRVASVFDQDIGNWDVSSVINMRDMFFDAVVFNQDIGAWDVSSVTNMLELFRNAVAFDQDIGGWDVGNVVNMGGVFLNTTFNQDIGAWDMSSTTDTRNMFGGTTAFNQDISGWDVSNVTDMSDMFQDAQAFNQDIGGWNVGNVTRMQGMFYRAILFNQDIGAWNTANITNMSSMFSGATSFDQNLEAWNVGNVIYTSNMFWDVTLSPSNYDALLIGWNAQNLQPNNNFHGGNSLYCAGEAARANMIAGDGWTISDGGFQGSVVDDLANQTHADSYTLPIITGSDLTGNEQYFTGPNGTGTAYLAGTTINYSDFPSYPVTLYIYDEMGTSPNCDDEEDFLLTLTTVRPGVGINASQEAKCDTETTNITLTAIPTPSTATGTYSYSWNIQGDPTVLGTNVTLDVTPSTTTIYEVTVTDDGLPIGSDTGIDHQTITVGNTPQIDQMADVEACDSYTLPTITGTYLSGYEVYSDDWAGAGNRYPAGSTISLADYPSFPITLYVYDENEGANYVCPNEMEFILTLTNGPTADNLPAVTECTNYALPALNPGNSYFSQTNGGGTQLNAGDIITTTQRLYIYSESGTAPNACSDESFFDVTIIGNATADNPGDVIACETYSLPYLSADNFYYTDTDAGGTQLNAGDVVTATQTIYVYSGAMGCSDENSFTVTINPPVTVDLLPDVTECEPYALPVLPNGNYFTTSGGQGSELFAGDTITTSQTIYIYFELGACSDESSFEVTIDPTICEETSETNCQIEFPKFFTPNGDGNNDIFHVMENPCDEQGILTIYDRYAKLLAQRDITSGGWDGTFQGEPLPASDYWYKFINTQNGQVSTGHFSLKR